MEAIATFLITFGPHMHILFITKVKNLVFIEWSYKYPLSLFIVKPRMVLNFEYTVQYLSNTCHFGVYSWSHT